MTFGSLFAGIGGFDLGLKRAGMRCAWQVEVDPYCRSILERHWPEVPKRGDIRLCEAGDLAPVDLICGGFPCQDISQAHSRRARQGLRGRHSGLWREFGRIVGLVRPRWVVVDNAPQWRRWMPEVRADLARDGYASVPLVMSAGQVGAPHSRPRGFVVAHADGDGESFHPFYAEMARLCSALEPTWASLTYGVDVDDGISISLALAALGNAVVPQVAEQIGRAILAVERQACAA